MIFHFCVSIIISETLLCCSIVVAIFFLNIILYFSADISERQHTHLDGGTVSHTITTVGQAIQQIVCVKIGDLDILSK